MGDDDVTGDPGTFGYRKTYRLGRGYSVEFVFDNGRMDVIWDPDIPPARVGRKLLPAYKKARDDFLTGIGVAFLVVDL